MVVDDLSTKTLLPILKENIAKEARVMTDEAGQYGKLSATFTGGHGFTRHGQGEYVDLVDRTIHTNTIEGAFSVFKRGMKGVYQHCGKQHLHRTSRSSISGTTIGLSSVAATRSGQSEPSVVSSGSGLPTVAHGRSREPAISG